MNMDREKLKHAFLIPAAIVLAGIIIALALFWVRGSGLLHPPKGDPSAVRPVDTTDHIIGSPTAPVIIVEYSDIDCQYCKNYQRTLEQLMTDDGPSGNVAWVYRHFPLVDIHPNAGTHAEAAECVASLGGEPLFWRFIDALQQAAPDINQFDPKGYDAVVSTLGVSPDSFNQCLAAHTFQARVKGDLENALASGATGTPYTVILIKGQKPVSFKGSVDYATLKKIVDQSVAQASAK